MKISGFKTKDSSMDRTNDKTIPQKIPNSKEIEPRKYFSKHSLGGFSISGLLFVKKVFFMFCILGCKNTQLTNFTCSELQKIIKVFIVKQPSNKLILIIIRNNYHNRCSRIKNLRTIVSAYGFIIYF